MQTLKLIFDTFGSTVFVPAMLFVISLCMRVSVKKHFPLPSWLALDLRVLLSSPTAMRELWHHWLVS